MKNKILTACLLTTLVFSGIANAQSDDKNNSEYGTFGVGFSFQPFSFASLLDEGSMVPVGGINLAFNLTEKFRLETDLGYMSVNDKYEDEKTNALNAGIGVFYTVRKKATAIMIGAKADYTTGSNDYQGGMGTTYTNKITAISFGPVLAYEYNMSKHFSVGGELGLKVRNFKEEADEDLNLTENEYKINSTFIHNAIFLRVYF